MNKPEAKLALLRNEYLARVLNAEEEAGLEAKREAYMEARKNFEQALSEWHAWEFAFKHVEADASAHALADADFERLKEASRELQKARYSYEATEAKARTDSYSPTPEAFEMDWIPMIEAEARKEA